MTKIQLVGRALYAVMLILFVILGAMLLASCAAPQPRIETVEVKVATPVPCLPKESPHRPVLQERAALLALGDYDLVLELAAERAELIAYAGQLEALVKACQ